MKQCMDADNLHRRLKKIIGQVQAIDRMVDEDVPCEDVLSQINAAKAACEAMAEMCADVGLPRNLKDAGVDPSKFEQMAQDCIQGKPFFTNPCKGTVQDLINIYKSAY